MRVFRLPSCFFMDSMAKSALDMGILWDFAFKKNMDFMGILWDLNYPQNGLLCLDLNLRQKHGF